MMGSRINRGGILRKKRFLFVALVYLSLIGFPLFAQASTVTFEAGAGDLDTTAHSWTEAGMVISSETRIRVKNSPGRLENKNDTTSYTFRRDGGGLFTLDSIEILSLKLEDSSGGHWTSSYWFDLYPGDTGDPGPFRVLGISTELPFTFSFNAHNTNLSRVVFGMEGDKSEVQVDNINFTPTPLPPAVWLMGTGLFGLVGLSRRRKTA